MWKALATAALLAQYVDAQAMLRFGCSQLVVERTDPIVNPGMLFTPHLHQIVGGNSFNATMDPMSHSLPDQSSCTSCSFKEDKSNYWTAVLFYKNKEGKFMRVPQVPNGGPQGKLAHKGGLDIYYMQPYGQGSKVTAFKPGFRMIAGNAAETNPSNVKRQNICFRCWKSTSEAQFTGGAPCTGADTVAIPADTSCKMFRQTIIFPDCWDGKNLDSANHQDHVSYSLGAGGATGGGSCPQTHPIKLPQIMYELMWNVSAIVDFNNFNTVDPYTLSMGIGGAAAHGDYVFGWEGNSLQSAMDARCNLDATCPRGGVTKQPLADYEGCTISQQAPEKVDGWLESLPLGQGISK